MPSTEWFPDWRGQTCVIIASGPSAKDAGVEIARGRARVLTINNSWRLAPWADALYGCDFSWWQSAQGVPEFHGLKISQGAHHFKDVKIFECDRASVRKNELILKPLGRIGWGANGGFQAINIAVQFGPPKRMILVGFDMRTDRGMHWHGPHPRGLNNPRPHHVDHWRKAIDGIAPSLKDLGVDVINASMVSALTAYPRMPLGHAL